MLNSCSNNLQNYCLTPCVLRCLTAFLHMLTGLDRMFESICLSVCLSVCAEHNSKMNDPKVFKLGVGNDPRNDVVLCMKGQGCRVSKYIFHLFVVQI